MKRRTLAGSCRGDALLRRISGYDMTRTGLRDDTTLGAIRLERWAASDWNGARGIRSVYPGGFIGIRSDEVTDNFRVISPEDFRVLA